MMKRSFQDTLNIADHYVEYGEIHGVRPDILWENKYAIELQHSPIKPEEIERRNTIYAIHGLIPVWIFHREEWLDDSYYERGRFGIETTVMDDDFALDGFVRLKAAERYMVEKNKGYILYFEFSKDIMFQGLTDDELKM